MKCIRCNKEIKENSSHVASMHEDRVIGYMHIACFNRQFNYKGEEDDSETTS